MVKRCNHRFPALTNRTSTWGLGWQEKSSAKLVAMVGEKSFKAEAVNFNGSNTAGYASNVRKGNARTQRWLSLIFHLLPLIMSSPQHSEKCTGSRSCMPPNWGFPLKKRSTTPDLLGWLFLLTAWASPPLCSRRSGCVSSTNQLTSKCHGEQWSGKMKVFLPFLVLPKTCRSCNFFFVCVFFKILLSCRLTIPAAQRRVKNKRPLDSRVLRGLLYLRRFTKEIYYSSEKSAGYHIPCCASKGGKHIS